MWKAKRMILLVHSNKDPAGINIARSILQQLPFAQTDQTFQDNPVYQAKISGKQVTFITLNEEAVNAQSLQQDFPQAELVVFVSRHSSQSGTPTLTVHTPGNFAEAELGGLPRTLSVSPANAMANALKTMKRLQQRNHLDYEVSYEVTHHGPSLNVPTMFVELGSSPKQWGDTAAAVVVAQATIEAIAGFHDSRRPVAIGIGGTHYNQKFTQMALDDEAVFGHMIPKYALAQVDAEILRQCIEKTLEKVERVILDWKGIRGEDKPRLMAAISETGLLIQKV